jgi:hypothetical protein
MAKGHACKTRRGDFYETHIQIHRGYRFYDYNRSCITVLALAGCPDPNGGGGGDPEITGFSFIPADNLVEGNENVATGMSVGTFGDPQGGTLPFVYGLTGGEHKSSFSIDGTALKVAGTPLAAGTYNVAVTVTDGKGKVLTLPFRIEVRAAGEEGDRYLQGTVSITGQAKSGQTLTANIDFLEGDGTPAYQWQRAAGEYPFDADYEDIPGANQGTYLLTAADVGKKVRVRVGRAGYIDTKASDPQTVREDLPPPAKPAVNSNGGAVPIGSRITLSTGTEGAYIYFTLDGSNPDPADDTVARGRDSFTITIMKDCTLKAVACREDDETVSEMLEVPFTVTSPPVSLNWDEVRGHGLQDSIISQIAFGNGTFVAVTTGRKVAYSKDNGDSWSQGNGLGTALNNKGVMDLVFVNSKFFVLGTDAQMAYSEDGANWTSVSIGGNIFKYDTNATANVELVWDNVFGLAWGNNKYVAVGEKGTIAVSSDLETWTSASGLIENGNNETRNRCITYAKDKFILGTASDMKYSDNGTTWQNAAIANSNDDIIEVVYGGLAGEEQFYALTNGGSGYVFSSTDGVTWTKVIVDVLWDDVVGQHRIGLPATSTALATGGGRVVVVDTVGDIFYSDDKGVNWVARDYVKTGVFINSTRNNIVIRDIAYGKGVFIAVGGGSPADGSLAAHPGAMAISNLHEPRD